MAAEHPYYKVEETESEAGEVVGYHVNFYGANGEIVLTSETYTVHDDDGGLDGAASYREAEESIGRIRRMALEEAAQALEEALGGAGR